MNIDIKVMTLCIQKMLITASPKSSSFDVGLLSIAELGAELGTFLS